MSDTSDTSYNGWKNYPTWAVNLWLSNEEHLYRAALSHAEQTKGRGQLADDLKAWVKNDLTPDLGASVAADLLGWALDSVDWFEIADAWIEMAGETVEA